MNENVVAIYSRVSTKVQSCELQNRELTSWCERHGLKVFRIYEDWGYSGRKASRPDFNRLMEDARAGHFKTVAVYKLCRFGRSVSDVSRNILELDAMGIRFVSITQGIDTNDKSPMAKVMTHMFAAFAQFETDILRERIQDGLENARKFGTKSGRPIGGRPVVFDRSKVIELRNQGMSYRKIAKRLDLGLGTVVRACSTNPLAKAANG